MTGALKHVLRIVARTRQERPRKLIDIVSSLPNNAKGVKVARIPWLKWEGESFYTIDRVKRKIIAENTAPGINRGKIWGFKTWRGETDTRPSEIRGLRKKEWVLVDSWASGELAPDVEAPEPPPQTSEG